MIHWYTVIVKSINVNATRLWHQLGYETYSCYTGSFKDAYIGFCYHRYIVFVNSRIIKQTDGQFIDINVF